MRVPRVGPVTYPLALTRGAHGKKRARLASVFFFLVLLPHGTEEAGEGASPATGRPAPAVSGEGDAPRCRRGGVRRDRRVEDVVSVLEEAEEGRGVELAEPPEEGAVGD